MVIRFESIEGAPPRRAPYSIASVVGGFAFLSGQGPFDTEDLLVTGSFEDQAIQAFSNIAAVVSGLGRTLEDVVRVGIYLQDMSRDFSQMNAIYQRFFKEPFPSRTTVPASGLRFAIEVDAIVWMGSDA